MVARVSRLLFFAWIAIFAGLLYRGVSHGWTIVVGIGLCVLVLGHPTLLAIEFTTARRLDARRNGNHVGLGAIVRAAFGEWLSSIAIFGWRQPWRAQAVPDHLPRGARGLRGVVFIHGFICNRAIWNPWLARLRKLDRAFVAVNLEPVFGSLDDYTATIEAAVRRVEKATGLAPIIVAHSMGGVVARAWLASRTTQARSDGQQDAARVITIGSPHRGTWLAGMAKAPNARQMRMDSAWMARLVASEPADRAALFTCWWSDCDQVVFPPPTGYLPGSESRRIAGVAHVALSQRREIWDELRRRLDE